MSFRQSLFVSACIGVAVFAGQPAFGQSADFDFSVETSTATPAAGEQFTLETILTARADGGQGWSYGLKHDFTLVEILDANFDGTDAAAIFDTGFQVTEISADASGNKAGMTQGVVLSLTMPIVVPITDRFVMASATYMVNSDACDDGVEKTVTFDYTSELGSAGGNGPPVEINFTVEGNGFVPDVMESGEITLCATPADELELSVAPATGRLEANLSATHDVDIMLARTAGGTTGAQAWSYALTFDGSLLDVAAFGAGADAAALNDGSGPAFVVNDPIDLDDDGTTDAIIGGGVVDFSKAQDSVLPLPVGTPQAIGSVSFKSAMGVNEDTTVDLVFETIPGNKKVSTIENLVTIGEESVTPATTGGSITLFPGEGGDSGPFIRGDANDDTRVDIADGIWILQFLFYGGVTTQCIGAADANGDKLADVADAMYLFNYRLQPGATPGNLFPEPPPPFSDGCGRDEELSAEDCAPGSTQCGG